MRRRKAGSRRRLRSQKSPAAFWVSDLLPFLAGAAAGSMGLLLGSRPLLAHLARRSLRILMTDPYDQNLLELFSATKRFGVQTLAETELRCSRGTVIARPLGSPKSFPNFSQLMFDVAQLHRMPLTLGSPIDFTVTIGPRANRPLRLAIPIMISGMAYGWALSESAKLALARGASMAGTATNTGQGAWLDSERRAADLLVYQYHRGHWGKRMEHVRQADAVEIQFGQGASAGVGAILEAKLMDEHLRRMFEVQPGEGAKAQSRQQEVQRPQDLTELVRNLRLQSGGVPIGVKLCPGNRLEQDLDYLLAADVDYIVIDGAEAATKGSPPVLEDDFGLPTLFALVRTVRYLEQRGVKDKVSLVVSGGLKSPGDYLKALALGADAVAIGTAALFAISHPQVIRAIPFEPPTQLVWYSGLSAKDFDWQQGAESLRRYLQACVDEMAEGIRALGKHGIAELSPDDLFALDQTTAEICGVSLGYQPKGK
ncbi:MAG: FMN-binding glutamate synthase family protein [Bacillota bacterium]